DHGLSPVRALKAGNYAAGNLAEIDKAGAPLDLAATLVQCFTQDGLGFALRDDQGARHEGLLTDLRVQPAGAQRQELRALDIAADPGRKGNTPRPELVGETHPVQHLRNAIL